MISQLSLTKLQQENHSLQVELTELRLHYEFLQESEHRYRTLFKLSSKGILRFGYHQPIPLSLPVDEQLELCYQSVYIAEGNEAFAKMYGYEKAEDLIGLTLNDFHDRHSEVTQATMRTYVENKHSAQNTETVEFDRYGRKRYFLNSSVSTTENDCVTSTWVSQVDITELREAQQALLEAEQARSLRLASRSQQLESLNIELQQTLKRLSESEERYRTLFEMSNEGIYRFEMEQPISTSLPVEEQVDLALQCDRFAEANAAFYVQMGVSNMDELLEFSLRNFQSNREQYRQLNSAIVQNSYQIRNAETEETNALGRQKFFLNNIVCDVREGCLFGGWGMQTDITELRLAQQALLEAEQERSQQLAHLNTELQQTLVRLEERERLLSVVSRITKNLLETEEVDSAILSALQAVGEAGNMSRVLLMLEHQESSTHDLTHRVIHEWTAEGICDHQSANMAVMENKNFQVLIQTLYQGQSIWHVIEDLPEVTRSQFKKLNIQSTGVVPIFIKKRYVGCVGFDDCVMPRQWNQQEIDVLTAAAESIGAALHRKQLVNRLVAERIQAEQERVVELAKTNQALKNSLDRLADEPDLDSFLGHVLTETSQQLQIDLGYLLFYDRSDRTLDLHMQVTPAGTSLKHELETTNPFRQTFSVEDLSIWDTLLQTQKPFIIDRQNAAQCVFQGTLAWQTQQQEHQAGAGINILLTIKDEPIGLLCFVSTKRSFSPQEIELAQALAQQATLAIQLTNLAEEAKQSAIFEERNRLAGEIHDTLAQTFTGISVQLELAQYLSQNNPAEVAAILDRIGSLAQTGLAEARRSVWSVYPTSEDYTDLAQKLTDCVTILTEGTDLDTQVRITGDSYRLSYFVGKNLLRIGQESITNTLKHARATILLVELIYTPNRVSLRIRDNGCGFSPQAQTEGFGLAGISERSDRINGQLRITTQPGEGTEILVQVFL